MKSSRFLTAGLLVVLCVFAGLAVQAQEYTAPLQFRAMPAAPSGESGTAGKTTALSLPFFEDFTDYSPFPNPARWEDSGAFVNNTMAVSPLSRGVATLDALNPQGRPYDTLVPFALVYADSLTTRPIDISLFAPGDSIYFSFFYQPQGRGFAPDPGDSLYVYFYRKNTSTWVRQWGVPGSGLQAFRQVLLPVTDTALFNDEFQVRFVNRASVGLNDDVWNIDYIRLNAGRSRNDTAVQDVAWTSDPTPLLKDYVSMPYRQFVANAAGERAVAIRDSLRNNYSTPKSVAAGYDARVLAGGTPLGSGITTVNLPPYSTLGVSFPAYTNTIPVPTNDKVVFRQSFFATTQDAADRRANDTAIYDQVFDNYLAYDDGTAERSYFLNLFPTLPGKVAIEHHLNTPDTLRGVAFYFAQQVPTASGKFFDLHVYQKIAGINGATTDVVLYTEPFLQPYYADSVNGFVAYRLNTPLLLPAGTFYVGFGQPAQSGSDSLYIGLDVNRVGSNHAYYNVTGPWQSSNISGALMIRPLLGRDIPGMGISTPAAPSVTASAVSAEFYLSPNPATTTIQIRVRENGFRGAGRFRITDLQGRIVKQGSTAVPQLDVHALAPGLYFVQLEGKGGWSAAQKFIKQ